MVLTCCRVSDVMWCMSASVIADRLLLPIITTEKVLDMYSISHNLIVQCR